MARTVAGGKQGEFAVVKERIIDRHRIVHDSEPNYSAAEARPGKRLGH